MVQNKSFKYAHTQNKNEHPLINIESGLDSFLKHILGESRGNVVVNLMDPDQIKLLK